MVTALKPMMSRTAKSSKSIAQLDRKNVRQRQKITRGAAHRRHEQGRCKQLKEERAHTCEQAKQGERSLTARRRLESSFCSCGPGFVPSLGAVLIALQVGVEPVITAGQLQLAQAEFVRID